jgi:hypothetical protein
VRQPNLVPDIPFIERHTVALEKQPKFLFECHHSVMLFLLFYVRDNRSNVRLAYRKGSIARRQLKVRIPCVFNHFEEDVFKCSMTTETDWVFAS